MKTISFSNFVKFLIIFGIFVCCILFATSCSSPSSERAAMTVSKPIKLYSCTVTFKDKADTVFYAYARDEYDAQRIFDKKKINDIKEFVSNSVDSVSVLNTIGSARYRDGY